MRLAFDRVGQARKRAQVKRFEQSRKAEAGYARSLRRVAKQIGALTRAYAPQGVVDDPEGLQTALARYAQRLRPFAAQTALAMLGDVDRRDADAWFDYAEEMGRVLRQELSESATGHEVYRLMSEQVDLITSLPTQAAERVHALSIEALHDSTRASEIAKQILATGDVTVARANLIARTETARAATTLSRARAQYVGSTEFTWVTAGDSDVRPEHRRLDGQIFRWDSPPVSDDRTGIRALPGCIWGCRCTAIPIIPE